MPVLARYFIKSALIWLVLGGIVAGLALSGAGGLPPLLMTLRPMGWHLLTVGWTTQLIFGVAFWMFPLMGKSQPRGDERLVWIIFWTVNIGLLLRVVGEPLAGFNPNALTQMLLSVSATLQLAAVVIFAILMWPRVKALGRPN